MIKCTIHLIWLYKYLASLYIYLSIYLYLTYIYIYIYISDLGCNTSNNTHTHNVEVEVVIPSTVQRRDNLGQNNKKTELVVLIKAYKNLRKEAGHEEKNITVWAINLDR